MIEHFITRETIEDLEPIALTALLLDLCKEEDGLIVRPSPDPRDAMIEIGREPRD